jgi:hypothetical protein
MTENTEHREKVQPGPCRYIQPNPLLIEKYSIVQNGYTAHDVQVYSLNLENEEEEVVVPKVSTTIPSFLHGDDSNVSYPGLYRRLVGSGHQTIPLSVSSPSGGGILLSLADKRAKCYP